MRDLITKLPAAKDMLAGAAGGKARDVLATIVRRARETARDESKSPVDRAAAVQALASSAFEDNTELFSVLLHSRQPQPVQVSALETLGRFDNSEVASLILAAWPAQTPQLRATSIETLFSRPNWISAFLDAVETGSVSRADVDPARIAVLQQFPDDKIRARVVKLFAGATRAGRQDVVDAYQRALELPGDVDRGRGHFRKTCSACHKLEGVGESIGADLNAIRDRGIAAVLLNILDPNREVKPQFHSYVVQLDSGRTLSGMITAETASSLTFRKADNSNETILRVDIEEIRSTGISFMPEGLEKQLDLAAMADLLAYLNAIQ
jgi:putative heme-binding domain-containing protein